VEGTKGRRAPSGTIFPGTPDSKGRVSAEGMIAIRLAAGYGETGPIDRQIEATASTTWEHEWRGDMLGHLKGLSNPSTATFRGVKG
jgi:hypothetical protein